MIFALFLVSVGVLELILRDPKKHREKPPAPPSPEIAAAHTRDLQSLAEAVRSATPDPDAKPPSAGATHDIPEYNREHVRAE